MFNVCLFVILGVQVWKSGIELQIMKYSCYVLMRHWAQARNA